ncbi:non-ribosomal peptide synthetase [Streptomyces sp. NPDC039022]|uniref:non-ribosomal peptide synthetase n=1 Tax=Streptomyces sp. NPDC039022 TaxID=3157091 RepID=UPI0033FE120D
MNTSLPAGSPAGDHTGIPHHDVQEPHMSDAVRTLPPSGTSGAERAPQTLVALFESTAARHPKRPAVSDAEGTLTYRELNQRAAAVARRLRTRGIGREDRVALYRLRSTKLFVSLLGILKAGAAYVAIDLRYPDRRRDLMIERSQAKAVLTEPGWGERLAHLGTEIIEDQGAPDPLTEEPMVGPRPEDAACVLFTSGSTGEPKGFTLEHRNVMAFAINRAVPELRPTDRTAQVNNVSFDAFHFETWRSLATGAEIVVMPGLPDLLELDVRREFDERGISALLLPTMAFNHLGHEDPRIFSSLRVLVAGGGEMQPAACRNVLDSGFRGSLWNIYGPSETTTGCAIYHVRDTRPEDTAVPLGAALDGFALHILDDQHRPVPRWEVGELFIGGPGVSRGYLGQPELTAKHYHPDPFARDGSRMYASGDLVRQRPDGLLEFVSRKDDQVKIRGYRVEPADVERALDRHPKVKESVVIAAGRGLDLRLVAFVTAHETLTEGELRSFAEEFLPAYMVPSTFLTVPALPLNENGKRDLPALRELLAADSRRPTEGQPPATATERYLIGLWQELFGSTTVRTTDDFFSAGGNSLLVYRTRQRVERDLGVPIGFRDILRRPVLKDLAAHIDATRAARSDHAGSAP